jgi:hypothetical protein
MARNAYIYRRGASPNTSLLNTQRVRLYSWDADDQGVLTQIGLVQTWNPSQTRAVEAGRGIGFGDKIAELGVGVTDLTATCTVLMMYLRDIMQIFGYKAGSSGIVRSLQHHRWPFDVKESIAIPKLKDQDAQIISTYYEACWMSDYSKAFNISDVIVTQDTSLTVTDIYDPDNEVADGENMTGDMVGNEETSALYQ